MWKPNNIDNSHFFPIRYERDHIILLKNIKQGKDWGDNLLDGIDTNTSATIRIRSLYYLMKSGCIGGIEERHFSFHEPPTRLSNIVPPLLKSIICTSDIHLFLLPEGQKVLDRNLYHLVGIIITLVGLILTIFINLDRISNNTKNFKQYIYQKN